MKCIKFKQTVNDILAMIESPKDFAIKNIDEILKDLSTLQQKTALHLYGSSFRTPVKMTPLQYAVYRNKPIIVQALVQNYNADVNQVQDPFQSEHSCPGTRHTALGLAVKQGYYNVVKLLTEKLNADVNLAPNFSPSPLHIAVHNSDTKMVKYLCDNGAKLKETLPNGSTYFPALMTAVEKDCEQTVEILEYFVAKGLDINTQDHCGHTPLHGAVKVGNITMVEWLLKHDAQSTGDPYGLTPLYVACLNQEYKTAEFIFQYLDSRKLIHKKEKETSLKLLKAAIVIHGYEASHSPSMYLNEILPNLPTNMDINGYISSLCDENEVNQQNNNINPLVQDTSYEYMAIELEIEIYEQILGKHNPYVATVLDIVINLEPENSLVAIMKQLEILQQLHEHKRNSITSVWVELALILSKVPDVSQSRAATKELFYTLADCAESFMTEQVWHVYHLSEWMNSFDINTDQSTADNHIENITIILYHIFKFLAPVKHNTIWTKIKEEVSKFIEISSHFLTQGKCLKSPLHILYNMEESKTPVLPHTADTIFDITKLLIQCGVNANSQDIKGNTPLHALVRMFLNRSKSLLSCGQLLVEHGAHIDAKNNDGFTPFDTYQVEVLYTTEEYSSEIDYTKLLKNDSPLPLKCMCSRVLRDERVQYKYCLPSHIISFVDIH